MAGSSKRLVFIPSISNKTWLLWSKRQNKVVLREYENGRTKKIRDLHLNDANALLDAKGTNFEDMSFFNTITLRNIPFWEEMIRSWNIQHGLVGIEKDKLQALFKSQCIGWLAKKDKNELKGCIDRWISCFGKMTKKHGKFNEYDDNDPSSPFPFDTGVGWQSSLLVNSRQDRVQRWIDTGDELTDFSFISMELTLTLSSRKGLNPIVPGTQSRINPDGLGIRKDGCFTVFEVKGPKDERDLLGPVLQAACGAAVVVAKAEMICEIAKTEAKLRPAYKSARIPVSTRSIGIHVLTAKNKEGGKLEAWSQEIEDSCRLLLAAFSKLKYIAFSFVEPEKTNGFTKVITDKVIQLKKESRIPIHP